MTRVLVVDNHDSFVHTLVGYLHELGAETTMVESDALDAAELERMLTGHDALLLSPGPGRPPA
ncbi:glutamine amidotransferase-related protein, partial [Microbacterium sp. AGC62]